MKETNFIINRSLTDNAPRELIINKDFLMFEDKDFANNITYQTHHTDR